MASFCQSLIERLQYTFTNHYQKRNLVQKAALTLQSQHLPHNNLITGRKTELYFYRAWAPVASEKNQLRQANKLEVSWNDSVPRHVGKLIVPGD